MRFPRNRIGTKEYTWGSVSDTFLYPTQKFRDKGYLSKAAARLLVWWRRWTFRVCSTIRDVWLSIPLIVVLVTLLGSCAVLVEFVLFDGERGYVWMARGQGSVCLDHDIGSLVCNEMIHVVYLTLYEGATVREKMLYSRTLFYFVLLTHL